MTIGGQHGQRRLRDDELERPAFLVEDFAPPHPGLYRGVDIDGRVDRAPGSER
jgi:hypothetical protein